MQVNRWWGLLKTLFVAFLFDFCFIRGHKCPDYLLLPIKMINQIFVCCSFLSAHQQQIANSKEAPKKIAFHFKITFHYHSARDSFTFFLFAFLFFLHFSTIDKTIKLWFMATNYIPKCWTTKRRLADWLETYFHITLLCAMFWWLLILVAQKKRKKSNKENGKHILLTYLYLYNNNNNCHRHRILCLNFHEKCPKISTKINKQISSLFLCYYSWVILCLEPELNFILPTYNMCNISCNRHWFKLWFEQ